MACSVLVKIATLCGIFYARNTPQTNQVVAATFKLNQEKQVTLLNDMDYKKCFPEFKTEVRLPFYKVKNSYLIIDEDVDLNSKCDKKNRPILRRKSGLNSKTLSKKLQKTVAVSKQLQQNVQVLKKQLVSEKITPPQRKAIQKKIVQTENRLRAVQKKIVVMRKAVEKTKQIRKELREAKKDGDRKEIVSLRKQLVEAKRAEKRLLKPVVVRQPTLSGKLQKTVAVSKQLQQNVQVLKKQLVSEKITPPQRKAIQKKIVQTENRLRAAQKKITVIRKAVEKTKEIRKELREAKKDGDRKEIVSLRKQLVEAKREETKLVKPVVVTQPVSVTRIQPQDVPKEVDRKEEKKEDTHPEEEEEDEEEEEEEDDGWKKYVHHSLHSHVENFIKNKHKHKSKNAHPAVHFFKKKVKEWWHDEEEDDEHDLKRMKHIFTTIHKHS